MLSEKFTLASHAGEDQSSAVLAARAAHWEKVRTAIVTRKGWSTTPEDFDTQALSNLIILNDWLRPEDIVYSADTKEIKLADLITADDIIAIMAARARALVGAELAANYPDISESNKVLINAALRAWIALCCPPEFFGVENIQPHKLTDMDLNAAARAVIGGEQ